ncbi:hypothetical protein NsoK4_09465 [Nitrosopumilus sp. K4]|uniref:hypothetical protein n=1 Tax=Nitrosopumilus sp. K4 TaxID=2795383 RepID=UPI001BAC203F|nr:hypothetical protein [Nitrosopumilus sp. K4]QUC64629.1 hypothetical protein NsoK4_09465 [Nitrosopumilus sp. K4]
MAFQLAVVILIPIILGIVTVSPFDEPQIEEPVQPKEIDDEPNFGMLYFFMMIIWFFFLFRILFQLKKGTFTLQRKY